MPINNSAFVCGYSEAKSGSRNAPFLVINSITTNKKQMEYYTYAYLREDGTPYYIGKGKNYRAYNNGGKPCCRPPTKDRIIILKNNLTEEDAHRHEIYMINVFGRKDIGTGILRNKTNGGEGKSGWVPSQETKNKLKEANLGRKHSKKTCEKMSKTRMGHLVNKETREKISSSLSKNTYLLRHVSGKEHIIENLSKFCRKNKLHQGRMMDRINGKVKKPYKGWTGQILKTVI